MLFTHKKQHTTLELLLLTLLATTNLCNSAFHAGRAATTLARRALPAVSTASQGYHMQQAAQRQSARTGLHSLMALPATLLALKLICEPSAQCEEQKTHLSPKEQGQYLLNEAVRRGDLESIQTFASCTELDLGEALKIAIQTNQPPAVKHLINAGAPMHHVEEYLYETLAKMLGRKDSDQFTRRTTITIELLMHNTDLAHKTYNARNTLLHLAAYSGNDKLASFLLEKKVHVDPENIQGATPLMLAAAGDHGLNTVMLLLEHDADITKIDCYGKSILDYAKDSHNPKIIKYVEEALTKDFFLRRKAGNPESHGSEAHTRPPVSSQR